MKIFCVISHTHWDREWYQPLEKFRRRLVDLIDNLLDIIETYPNYIFHLDAQTIVLKDYLEIRPDKEEILKKHIRSGSIIVGPWYVQNDFYLTSGEATIRNLLYGTEMANRFGACSRVGYAPDQFGNMSQLPQILKSFQSDNFVFGRGYTGPIYWEKGYEEFRKIAPPSEFIWEGADGTRVLGVHMTYWYNNCQRISQDPHKALKLMETIEKSFEGVAATPYLLLMNGVDHLEAQENLLPLLDEINRKFPQDKRIEQTTMQSYIDRLKASLDGKDLTVYKGELRNGNDGNVLQNTLSSRIYLKTANAELQNRISHKLEPLYTFLSMAGAKEKYDRQYFDYIWKLLLENHPHDSICGCSVDETHNQMENRNERLFALTDDFLSRGMEFLSNHTDKSALGRQDYLVTVCHLLEQPFTGVVEARVEIPAEEHVSGFGVTDENLRPVPFEVVSQKRYVKNFFSPINLPGGIAVDSFKIRLFVELPPFSFSRFFIRPGQRTAQAEPGGNSADGVMENAYLKVAIQPDGTVDLTDKATGACYPDVFTLEDTEDTGDAYVFHSRGLPAVQGEKPVIERIADTALQQTYRLTYHMELPAGFDHAAGRRTRETAVSEVVLELGLSREAKTLEIAAEVDNHSENHRLRLVINSGIRSDMAAASIPFDVVQRNRKNDLQGAHNNDHPNNGFVDISDGACGLAVLTQGVYEYNHLKREQGKIAFTLLRATGGFADYSWLCAGTQCKRRVKMRLGLLPHAGNWQQGNVEYMAKEFQNAPLCASNSADAKKFSGGTPVVQDSEIKEVFFRPDPHEGLTIDTGKSFLSVTGGVSVTAVKKAQQGEGYVVRLFNPFDKALPTELRFLKPVREANLCTMEEIITERLTVENRCVRLTLNPKQILTVMAQMNEGMEP